jgi:hypothetical protein
MWWFIAIFVVSLLLSVAAIMLMPKPESAKPPIVGEIKEPTAEDGREITVLFGTRDFPDLQIAWWGDTFTGPKKDHENNIVIGYHYYVGMHLIACHGPVDFLSGFWVDNRPLYYTPEGPVSGGSVLVDNTDLFGGPAAEGGVLGNIDIEMGYPTQSTNNYLKNNLGSSTGNIPAFRGVVGLVLRRPYIGDTPYLKKWKVRLQRIHIRQSGITEWYDEKASIGPITCSTNGFPTTNNDMNPIHIIRECLTDPDWGISDGDNAADEESFIYAADLIYAEGMGMSIKYTSQSSMDEFIDLIKKHINAELTLDYATGKYKIKLIRDDYNPNNLLVLSESDIVKIENANRPLIGELVNSVTVKYWNICTGKDASVTVQDQALIHMQGKEINTTMQYPGFTNKKIASRVATRDLRVLSSQPLSCSVYVKRTAEVLNIGDVFVLHWPDLEIISIVMRVQNIDYGNGTSNTIRMDVVEDVFGLQANPIVEDNPDDPSWKPPINKPKPLIQQLADEAPYYTLIHIYGQGEIDAKLDIQPILGYVVAAGVRVSDNDIDAVVSANLNNGGYNDTAQLDFCAGFILNANINQINKVFPVVNTVDIDKLELGGYAQIDNELVRVDSIDLTTSEITVGRGVLDTEPRNHSAGSYLTAWSNNNGFDTNKYIENDAVKVKIRPTTGKGTLNINDATTLPVKMIKRAIRPYPPGNFRVDGNPYPSEVIIADFTVTWAHRDRLLEVTPPLIDHTYANDIGPEVGTTYEILIIDSNNAVVDTYSGITGTSQLISTVGFSDAAYTLQIYSKRDGIASLQSVEWMFNFFAESNVKFLAATYSRS